MSLTLEEVQAKSAARLAGLHEVVKLAAGKLIERCYHRGVYIRITQGLRTMAEQEALYAQGRTKPGAVVTNAKPGYSFHNFGVAIDFALLLPDGKSVSWDMSIDGDRDKTADWHEVVAEAKALGFEWGGDWRSFKDYPHLEMTFGLTTAQYRAGAKPSQAAVEAMLKKINAKEGEEPMTAEEKKEFEALKVTVREQAALIQTLTGSKDTLKEWLTQMDGRVKTLEGSNCMDVPEWAKEAVQAAQSAGLIDSPSGGSLSFYRLLTVLHRSKLIRVEV